MAALFGRTPVAQKVMGDRVVPLHFFEQSQLVQGNNMAVTIVFDEVLCPEKLRVSLEGLIRREGWERLGARLKKNVGLKPIPISLGALVTLTISITGRRKDRMAYSGRFHSRTTSTNLCPR